ncbi:MAG: hypothetical protein JWN46_947, partial [Acidimicrobiales bacterium]|nr:hypothetical protein [Acidimicrobiales bacterium]
RTEAGPGPGPGPDGASAEGRLAALEAQVGALLDEREIAGLMYRYIEACDHIHDPDLIAGFFTDDAVWEGAGRYAEWGTSRGRAAIRAQFADTPDVLPFTVHWLTNPRVDVGPDRATATGRWEVLQAATFGRSATPVWVGARYDNELRATDEGWRIHHLRYADVFVTPFDEGWVTTPYVSPFA